MRKISPRTKERIMRLLKDLSEQDAQTVLFFIEKILESRSRDEAAKHTAVKSPSYPES
ncbi:MAG: hypothetical protein ACREJQ_04455 [bacterium]